MTYRIVKYSIKNDSFPFRYEIQRLGRAWWWPWKMHWYKVDWHYSQERAELRIKQERESLHKYGRRHQQVVKVDV